MDQHYRRMGLGKEAVSAGIQLAFQDLKLHRIEAFCMPGNQPSLYKCFCHWALNVRVI